MKTKIVYEFEDITGVEGQKRLDHYNAWLGDPKRKLGTFYPGYPKDIENESSSLFGHPFGVRKNPPKE